MIRIILGRKGLRIVTVNAQKEEGQLFARRGRFDVLAADEEGRYYEIEVQKLDADENVVASNLAYTEFSYSKEYDPFLKQEDNKAFIAGLAETGGGNRISEAAEVFADLVKSFYRTFDPRGIFAITIIVSLLLDVAVRKFKFKWPHEIIREKKQKKLEGLSAKNRLDRTDSKEL